MDDIHEICKHTMDRLHLTTSGVAEASGLSESTVRNFVTGGSKNPTLSTVVPICRTLGVSLDEFFDIPSHRRTKADEESLVRDLNFEVIRVKELDSVHAEQVRSLRRIVAALLALCIVMAVGIVGYLVCFDLSNQNYGLFRW